MYPNEVVIYQYKNNENKFLIKFSVLTQSVQSIWFHKVFICEETWYDPFFLKGKWLYFPNMEGKRVILSCKGVILKVKSTQPEKRSVVAWKDWILQLFFGCFLNFFITEKYSYRRLSSIDENWHKYAYKITWLTRWFLCILQTKLQWFLKIVANKNIENCKNLKKNLLIF